MAKPNYDRIEAALRGELETTELTAEEDAIWLERFTKLMGEPGPEEEAFFARCRRLGLGVGLDEHGNLVYAKDQKREA